MSRTAIAIAAAVTGLAGAASSWAATPLSVRDSWRIGNAGTSFCSAQSLTTDKALTNMFDAGYSITCRDAALPVGKLYKLRGPQSAAQRLQAIRGTAVDCSAPRKDNLRDLGTVDIIDCRLKEADVSYRTYQLVKGDTLYAAEGLAGYDSALQLGLRSVVSDRRIPGNLNVGFPGIDADRLLAALPELSLSTGSACSSAAVEPSYVLAALGLDAAAARGAVRIGLGRFTTEAEVDFAVERLVAGVRSLRREPAAAAAP